MDARSAPREACGVPAEQIVAAARAFGAARRAMVLWSMGANQSTVGTLKNRALINLCLATGNIGRPGTGPLSLTGQPNAMGGRESGGLAHLLPGYRKVTDPDHRAEMRRLWDVPAGAPGISPAPGIAPPSSSTRSRTTASRSSGSWRRTRWSASPTPRASPPRCAAPSS